jgi:hypothetical protein
MSGKEAQYTLYRKLYKNEKILEKLKKEQFDEKVR